MTYFPPNNYRTVILQLLLQLLFVRVVYLSFTLYWLLLFADVCHHSAGEHRLLADRRDTGLLPAGHDSFSVLGRHVRDGRVKIQDLCQGQPLQPSQRSPSLHVRHRLPLPVQ